MAQGLFRSTKNRIKYWWTSTIIGLLAIILGVLCLSMPTATLAAMTYIFIIAFLLGGITDVIFAVANRDVLLNWGWRLSGGILNIFFGLVLLIIPTSIITTILIYFIGFGILYHSISGLIDVIGIRKINPKGWGWLLATMVAIVLLSLMFLISPLIFKGKFIVTLISLTFILFGIFKIYISLQTRKIYKEIKNF